MTDTNDHDLEGLAKLKTARDEIRRQVGTAIVGQDEVVNQLLVCLFARGHCVLEGVPGLAKTLLIRTLARCLSLDFNRVQFTPDLMPSDITGTDVMYDDKATPANASSSSSTARCSPTSSWPTRSTARPPRPRPRCWRPCRNGR